MVEDNLMLVHLVLKRMGLKHDYEDFFSTGCVGLCRAAAVYKKGNTPFSTFACHFIRHEIINYCIYLNKEKKNISAALCCKDCESTDVYSLSQAEAALLYDELAACVDELLCGVTARVIKLTLRGENSKEIAKALGVSLSSVYQSKGQAKPMIERWIRG